MIVMPKVTEQRPDWFPGMHPLTFFFYLFSPTVLQAYSTVEDQFAGCAVCIGAEIPFPQELEAVSGYRSGQCRLDIGLHYGQGFRVNVFFKVSVFGRGVFDPE